MSKTQVDALAIAIGTSHGAYKFTSKPTGKVLRIDRVKEIHKRIPSVHLVMHGSSSVPEDWLAIINQYGGDMGVTYGVPVDEIVEGIKHGVRYQSVATYAPAPGARSWLGALRSPWGTASTAITVLVPMQAN